MVKSTSSSCSWHDRKRRADLMKPLRRPREHWTGGHCPPLWALSSEWTWHQKRHNDVEPYFKPIERLELAGIIICFFLFMFCMVFVLQNVVLPFMRDEAFRT
ncbi:hypothetical protein niasHT_017835 [Heterodera trifolii]|uniref:Uncharacterized protein n=1 Tax=Heterodera trifolii TaxID=157864 RepID=A0ABD2LKD4_9BILA